MEGMAKDISDLMVMEAVDNGRSRGCQVGSTMGTRVGNPLKYAYERFRSGK